MAKIIGLAHTDGKRAKVKDFKIGGSSVVSGSPENDGYVVVEIYKNQDWEDRSLSGTLDPDFEKVGIRRYTENNILDSLTQTPDGSTTDGERIWQLVYTYVRNQMGAGWSFVYET